MTDRANRTKYARNIRWSKSTKLGWNHTLFDDGISFLCTRVYRRHSCWIGLWTSHQSPHWSNPWYPHSWNKWNMLQNIQSNFERKLKQFIILPGINYKYPLKIWLKSIAERYAITSTMLVTLSGFIPPNTLYMVENWVDLAQDHSLSLRDWMMWNK